MKNKKYIIFIAIVFAIFLIAFSNNSYAGSQTMKDLKYDVQLNEDGSMDVVETWKIRVSDTNTLFKTFQKDSSKYGEITNVTVAEIKDNEEIKFKEIYQEMYHVTKGCFYALDISSTKFEIAWGVSIDSSETKTYKISYTVTDAVKVYNDCNELYWQFLSTDNGIPANKVTGTIKLPEAVGNIDNLRVWAHGPLNGEINIKSKDTVEFAVEDLETKTRLEVRVVTKEDVFPLSTNKLDKDQFDKIISEETKLADEANEKREMAKKVKNTINIVFLLIAVWFLTRSVKYIKKLKEVKRKVPQTEVEYYRDMPDENATPADAAFLYYFSSGGVKPNISKIFSATLLDLCLKKMLTFEIKQEDKTEDVKIVLVKDKSETSLTKSEQIVYEQLKKVEKENNGAFTVKELQKYIKNHSERFVKDLEKIEDAAKNSQIEKQNFDKVIANKGTTYTGLAICYAVMAFLTLVFGVIWGLAAIVTVVVFIINVILCGIISSRYNGLTQKGVDERELWYGLKKYMQDFSLLKEREVPELVLWEKYLVFATVFGIADRVIKQLKVVYPQIEEGDLIGEYAYMHMMYHSNLNLSFITSLNSTIASSYTRAYNSTYSSGSGYGGGFSGGGGGRRWRRPEWAEDKKN